MRGITLTHLTFLGTDRLPASVEFSPRLTVIHGASDSGKSFVVDSIDYMLGSSKLKKIPEGEGYSHILLGVELPGGDQITLVRNPDGGKIGLYRSDIREIPEMPPDDLLSPDNKAKSSLSKYFLREIGLEGSRIRRNAKNETRGVSIRNVCHVSIIDETRMQADRSPVFPTGQYVSQTAENSLFRVLLEGEDDSSLTPREETSEQKKISKGKVELLNKLIGELTEEGLPTSDIEQLRDQQARLAESIDALTDNVQGTLSSRDIVLERRQNLIEEKSKQQYRLSEIHDLLGRFRLLSEQYESDLSRLSMIEEAGNLLGFFDVGTCVFCGASREHQTINDHMTVESTNFSNSVASEVARTWKLKEELNITIEDLVTQHREVSENNAITNNSIRELDLEIESLEAQLQPMRDELAQLIGSQSDTEKEIARHEQVAKLEALRTDVSESEDNEEAAVDDIDNQVLHEFTEIVKNVLVSWQVPEAGTVSYNKAESDLVVGNQARAVRGKGMRAVLHAAFTVGLAEYCLERGLPHLGVVVLDSPIITYRAPDDTGLDEDGGNELMNPGVAEHFYRYLSRDFEGQSIVVENVDPSSGLSGSIQSIKFTKSRESGRFGFFPVG